MGRSGGGRRPRECAFRGWRAATGGLFYRRASYMAVNTKISLKCYARGGHKLSWYQFDRRCSHLGRTKSTYRISSSFSSSSNTSCCSRLSDASLKQKVRVACGRWHPNIRNGRKFLPCSVVHVQPHSNQPLPSLARRRSKKRSRLHVRQWPLMCIFQSGGKLLHI